MNNVEIIEAGFHALCNGYASGVVNLKQTSLFSDLFVCIDVPEHNRHRFTYVKLDSNKEVLAMCVFIVCLDKGTTDVGWFVLSESRGKGIGKDIVEKSFEEFKHGMARAGVKLLTISATIDEGNTASISLGRLFIGGEEIITKDDGSVIYSYLNSFRL